MMLMVVDNRAAADWNPANNVPILKSIIFILIISSAIYYYRLQWLSLLKSKWWWWCCRCCRWWWRLSPCYRINRLIAPLHPQLAVNWLLKARPTRPLANSARSQPFLEWTLHHGSRTIEPSIYICISIWSLKDIFLPLFWSLVCSFLDGGFKNFHHCPWKWQARTGETRKWWISWSVEVKNNKV